jgi:tetratricopeptide (TPR) repeat protein
MKTGVLFRALLMAAVLAVSCAAVRIDVAPKLLLLQGDQYRAQKQYTLAMEQYAELGALRPRCSVPHARLGEIYVAQGRWDEAKQQFEQARELDERDTGGLSGLAQIAAHEGDLWAAVQLWRTALATNPRDVEARYGLAQAYIGLSEFAAAKEELAHVVNRQVGHQGARYLLGLLCAPEERALALEHLSIAASGGDPSLAAAAGEMLAVMGGVGGDQDVVREAALLGHAYLRLEQPTLALEQLKRLATLQPENYNARAYAGWTLLSLNELDSARRTLRQITHEDPKNQLAYYFLGLLHRSEGYLPTALWEFQRALRLDASNAAVYAEIAVTYQLMGRLAEAEEWYRAAISVAPDELGFHLLLAQFYADVVLKPERALVAASDTVALAPGDPAARELLGWAEYLLGNLAEARVSLEHALQLDPTFARAYYHLGIVYEELGDQDKARWAFHRAVDLDQEGMYRAKAAERLHTSG